MGRWLILIGIIILIIGIVVQYAPSRWWLWFGRLPGDVRIEKGNVRIYFPWVSTLIISIILSVILTLWRRMKL
jgi:uncharacterized membrane protein